MNAPAPSGSPIDERPARLLDCPSCGRGGVEVFYEATNVPVNSCLQIATREEALEFPTGDMALGFCGSCGFIYNTAFQPELLEYSERYQPTQAFSDTFNRWHRELAQTLIERYQLRNKKLIEIGCGKGEFLMMLTELGDNQGVGFDPAFEATEASKNNPNVDFVVDFYGEKYADRQGDFVCCKMTLEHIRPTSSFIQTVRRSVGDNQGTVVFFQVPDVRRILGGLAYWDVYYEHCSYFSVGSLARLFRRNGFAVQDVQREYDDQYLMVEARPAKDEIGAPLPQENDIADTRRLVDHFKTELPASLERWKQQFAKYRAAGQKVVIWGSGSKGVSFLTTLGLSTDDIEYVVDINPGRSGHFMVVTGQQIVRPDFLVEYQPDVVIVMNPIYLEEIRADLAKLGLAPDVIDTDSV